MGKYEGIDSREIECCDQSTTTIEAGISFEEDDGQNIFKISFS